MIFRYHILVPSLSVYGYLGYFNFHTTENKVSMDGWMGKYYCSNM